MLHADTFRMLARECPQELQAATGSPLLLLELIYSHACGLVGFPAKRVPAMVYVGERGGALQFEYTVEYPGSATPPTEDEILVIRQEGNDPHCIHYWKDPATGAKHKRLEEYDYAGRPLTDEDLEARHARLSAEYARMLTQRVHFLGRVS